MSNLNIYKVSGVAKVGYTGKVNYWLANTNDLANTRAMNYVLSEINLLNTELSVTTDKEHRIELMNLIDLYTIVLEGLVISKDSEVYNIETIGYLISNMLLTGSFTSTSDNLTTRANNLDALITDFKDRLNNIPNNLDTDVEFDIWFSKHITDEDYNDTPEYALKNYEQTVKIGANDVTSVSQKSSDAGPAFLYMFMTDKQINACNDTIKKRFAQEVKNWQWETKIVRGAFSEQTLYNLYRNGCILHYGQTPEKVIDELFALNEKQGGGKVGEPITAIISAVVAVVSLIISLVYLIIDIYKITYEADDDYKDGVPDQSGDGWNLGDALAAKEKGESLTTDKKDNKKKNNTGSSSLIYIGIAAIALLAFL